MTDAYADFLASKQIADPATGLASIPDLHPDMFDFQRDITGWALRRGRAALFAGTGLGKSLMELAWADAVYRATGKDILHLAPLAVSAQLEREARKFHIPAKQVRFSADCVPGTNITNYQKVEHFDLSQFGGVILDESSILKSTDGKYRTHLIAACAGIPFRLAATATPAPNDFMELGNHAEFLGVMSYTDMLATFFTHDGGDTQKWRLKGHAENEFWKWMASWSVMIRKPSDLGYEDGGYDLPPLRQQQHIVSADYSPSMDTGLLFPMEARTMQERLGARRDTIDERVAMAFQIVIGNISAKLAECHGSQNTPNGDEQNISPTRMSESDGSLKAETPSGTPNTCATTTSKTQESSGARRNNRKRSTGAAASVTLPTQSTEIEQNSPLVTESRKLDELAASDQSTEWAPPPTTHLLLNRAAGAPYAETDQSDISTLTTAIQLARLEGCFAAPATLASVISEMTRSGLIEPWCIWCNLNSEQEALAKAFGPLAYSVSGSMPDEQKEAAILDWIDRKRPVMISKPSILGFGMNFQHCRNTVFVGLNDSFEQVFQAIRRFWRFGQTKPVSVHFIAAETEGAVVANLRRKEADADRMAAAMVMHTKKISTDIIRGAVRDIPDYNPTKPMSLPIWLEKVA
jgi:hypothetical protein